MYHLRQTQHIIVIKLFQVYISILKCPVPEGCTENLDLTILLDHSCCWWSAKRIENDEWEREDKNGWADPILFFFSFFFFIFYYKLIMWEDKSASQPMIYKYKSVFCCVHKTTPVLLPVPIPDKGGGLHQIDSERKTCVTSKTWILMMIQFLLCSGGI